VEIAEISKKGGKVLLLGEYNVLCQWDYFCKQNVRCLALMLRSVTFMWLLPKPLALIISIHSQHSSKENQA